MVRHRRANPQNPQMGGRVETEAPIHISNVMPWSDAEGKGVRVRFEEAKDGKQRVSAASGKAISAAATKADDKK